MSTDHRSNGEFDRLVSAMSDPSFYPGAPTSVDVHETHISWVFVAGDRAYKLKKPVVFPFLDYGSRERRREMCERELHLNRRLAPDVYLGVRGIVRGDTGFALAAPGTEAIEHVVEMRRFDEGDTLRSRVVGGRVAPEQVGAVGRSLARFHAAGTPSRDAARGIASVLRNADGNFEGLLVNGTIAPGRVLAAQRFTDAFLARHGATLANRVAAGLVRDGHGDLRAEHVLVGNEVQVVDCAEFDPGLREIDVGADLAFLVMDLERLGRPDLGTVLVDAYRTAGGDPGTDQMIAFHAAIRAWVRAKVALLRDRVCEARELFGLGERLAWRARAPLTVIVCGPPASGKSRLAKSLSQASGLRVIGSDVTRKRILGIAPNERAPDAAYDPRMTSLTYAELGRRAATDIASHGGAIIDVAFGRSRDRDNVLRELPEDAQPIVMECRAPAAVLQQRARAREHDPGRISDAGPDVAENLRLAFDPLEDAVAPDRHFMVRTDRSEASVLEDVVAMLDLHLSRHTASS